MAFEEGEVLHKPHSDFTRCHGAVFPGQQCHLNQVLVPVRWLLVKLRLKSNKILYNFPLSFGFRRKYYWVACTHFNHQDSVLGRGSLRGGGAGVRFVRGWCHYFKQHRGKEQRKDFNQHTVFELQKHKLIHKMPFFHQIATVYLLHWIV